MGRRKRKRKSYKLILIIILMLLLVIGIGYVKLSNKRKLESLINEEEKKVQKIKLHFNNYVITEDEGNLFDKDGNIIGKIGKGVYLELEQEEITKDTKYFKLSNFENTYISYSDVSVIKEINKSDRYKKYIYYNENIKTKAITTFYDEHDNLVYSFNKSYDFPIIIKDNDRYGIEFDNMLLFVKKDDVDKVYQNSNTNVNNSNGVAVLNYHFFYDDADANDTKTCNEGICVSKSQFKGQLDLIKEMDILTITMDELELYMDGKLKLPRSVLITIDDGARTKIAVDMLTEYKMNATIFLITSWYNPADYYKTDYIELHSHSHNLHNGGKCPLGQGGEIKCLDKQTLLNDLKQSRELLNGSRAFCYPFYEYNSYSQSVLKEAGFTMAFIGEVNTYYGYKLAEVGSDKMVIPRFVMFNYTTLSDLREYFNEIK